jgi:hypothetical protein
MTGKKYAQFAVSELAQLSMSHSKLLQHIRFQMQALGIEKITWVYKSPSTDATVFAGPVKDESVKIDLLVGMLEGKIFSTVEEMKQVLLKAL